MICCRLCCRPRSTQERLRVMIGRVRCDQGGRNGKTQHSVIAKKPLGGVGVKTRLTRVHRPHRNRHQLRKTTVGQNRVRRRLLSHPRHLHIMLVVAALFHRLNSHPMQRERANTALRRQHPLLKLQRHLLNLPSPVLER